MKVSLQYAENHLGDLATAVDAGEEVEIARPGKAGLRLVVSATTLPAAVATGRRVLGAGRGEMRVPSEAEWREMDLEDSNG